MRNPDVLVVDANQVVIGTSDISKRNIIGQQTNDVFIKRALVGTTDEGNFVDAQGNIYRSSKIGRFLIAYLAMYLSNSF